MKLVEMSVREYLNELKSNSPAPGGGSVSALASAQGIALMMMVCDLTIGRPKYIESEALCLDVKEKGKQLLEELQILIDKDTEAYTLVSDSFKLPKESEEEKKLRSEAIAEATLTATETPFRTMEISLEGLALVESLIGKTNVNAASDLGVAGLNLFAGIKGAWLNVKINLPGVKNLERAEFFREKGKEMESNIQKMLETIETKTAELI